MEVLTIGQFRSDISLKPLIVSFAIQSAYSSSWKIFLEEGHQAFLVNEIFGRVEL